ncbi:glycoside hydrolase [Candidatus Pantoea multigeneris]|nr:glycoside hydrolase [Pantoea multigeneris]
MLRNALFVFAMLSSTPLYALTLQQGETVFTLDPATLRIHINHHLLNQGVVAQQVAALQQDERAARWYWPGKQMHISASLQEGDLLLTFQTSTPQAMNWYHLPDKAETLLLPIGEGSRIPLDDPEWRAYLQQEMNAINTHWDLKLPLWSQQHQQQWISWLMLNPYDNELQFSGDATRVMMQASHKFSPMSLATPFRVLLTVGDTPLSGAIRYREQLQQQGQFSSLAEKMAKTQDGNKLIGASHLYLWGNGLLAAENVRDWPGLIDWLRSESGIELRQRLANDIVADIQQIGSQRPEKWQQIQLIEALNQAITTQVKDIKTDVVSSDLTPQQQQAAAVRDWTQQHLAQWLTPPTTWGQSLSLPLLESLQLAGLPRLWLGTDNWTAALLNPAAIGQAKNAGWLVASYDSYDTAIPRGINNNWLTAQIPTNLGEKCAIVRENGTRLPGFGGAGYYLNPGCMLDWSRQRMQSVVTTSGINSLFLDVDGTAMVRDDFHPRHPTSAAEMATARNQRLAWVGEKLGIPVGSEDGNALTAQHLLFAHGTETWGFGWQDTSIHQDKTSPWFLGAWWPESQPAQFFQPTKLKPRYKTVVFDPRYRVPLYQAVFHDSVIATHHWTYDNLKFPEVKRNRDLLSLLYNTPPLFNLSRASLALRLPEIVKMDRLFRPMHEILWDKALVDFRWLDETGWVQQTRFSDGSLLSANFSEVVRAGIQPYELVMHRPSGEVIRFSL